MSDDIDMIDTPEYRAGLADGREMAAQYLERRAKQFEDGTDHNIGTTMAIIYRAEASKLREAPLDD
ncbi:hypothetical protein N8569_00740 [bacterium]|nr:hypothetical protein [bacterium]